MDIVATLDGVTFTTSDGLYTVEPPDGWFSGAPVKTPVQERPASNGAFGDTRFYRAARPITFSGSVMSTPDSLLADCERLSAILADGFMKKLTVTRGAEVRSAMVRLVGGGASITIVDDQTADFVLSLVAPDAVRYGPERDLVTGLPTAGGGLTYNLFDPAGALDYGANGNLGRVQLSNLGTAEVWPRLRIDGGLATGFFAQRLDTGQTVRYDRVVPLGSWVDVDFATGAVVVDGVSDGSTYLTRGEFFSVPPGAQYDVQFNGLGTATGTPLMTMTIAEGYW